MNSGVASRKRYTCSSSSIRRRLLTDVAVTRHTGEGKGVRGGVADWKAGREGKEAVWCTGEGSGSKERRSGSWLKGADEMH